MQARFFDGQSAAAHDVLLTVQSDRLSIRSVDGSITVDWPVSEIIAQTLPHGNVTFRRGKDMSRLSVSDPATTQRLSAVIRRRTATKTRWGLAILVSAGLIAGTFGMVDTIPARLAPLVPMEWQQALANATQTILVAEHPPCAGTAGQFALDRFAAKLAASAGLDREIRIVVVDDNRINAFTLPGDRVLVLRGLINAAQDGDELAGVLAHELGHVARLDPSRQLIRLLGLRATAWVMGLSGSQIGDLASTIVTLSYERAAETAADAFAITTLQQAGLRADGLGRFFARAEASAEPEMAFLSDHPPTPQRRAAVAQPPDGHRAFDDVEWRAIRTMCDQP